MNQVVLASARQLLLVASLLGLAACRQSVKPTARQYPAQSRLGFQDLVLKQSDPQGRLLWQLRAKAADYRDGQQVAQLKDITGELYQDGQPVYRIAAKQAAVTQKAQQVMLKGNLVATDLRNQAVFKGKNAVWTPQADRLVVTEQLQITHPQVQMWAKELQASGRQQQVTLMGQVRAETRSPVLRLQAERLSWRIDAQRMTAENSRSATPVQIDQLQQGKVRQQLQAMQADLNLAANVMTLSDKVEADLVEPALRITTSQLDWFVQRQTVRSNRPLQVYAPQQQVTMTAQQGILEQAKELVQLRGNVQVTGLRNGSTLQTNQLTWSVPGQQIEAVGNVVYRQNQPRFNLQGQRAIGKITEQTIQISGGNVVTEVVIE